MLFGGFEILTFTKYLKSVIKREKIKPTPFSKFSDIFNSMKS